MLERESSQKRITSTLLLADHVDRRAVLLRPHIEPAREGDRLDPDPLQKLAEIRLDPRSSWRRPSSGTEAVPLLELAELEESPLPARAVNQHLVPGVAHATGIKDTWTSHTKTGDKIELTRLG